MNKCFDCAFYRPLSKNIHKGGKCLHEKHKTILDEKENQVSFDDWCKNFKNFEKVTGDINGK
jgi:hypothetical protein